MDERVKWIQHKGKRILFVDGSNLRDEASLLKILDEVEAELMRQPKGVKYLTLFYSQNSIVSKVTNERSKQMIANLEAKGIPTGPSAVVGTSGFQRAIISAMQLFVKSLHTADSVEEAKEWLVAQKID